MPADRLGPENVSAVDPSEPFVAALPFADDEFDAALSQLAVNFMADPRPASPRCAGSCGPAGPLPPASGTTRGEMTLLRTFWEAAAALEPDLAAGRDERRCGRSSDAASAPPAGPFELSARAWYAVGTT